MSFYLIWVTVVHIISLTLAVFFIATTLGIKRGRLNARLSLAGLICVYAVLVLPFFLVSSGLYPIFPHSQDLLAQFYFLLGPCLLLYVKLLIDPEFRFRRTFWLHIIPFGFNFIYWLPASLGYENLFPYLYTTTISSTGLDSVLTEVLVRNPVSYFKRLLMTAHFLIYFVYILRVLRLHGKRIRDSFSTLDRIKLGWVRFLSVAISIDVVGYSIFSVLVVLAPQWVPAYADIFCINKTLIIFFMGYKGFTQPEIFVESESLVPAVKYLRSNLTAEQSRVYLKKLLDYMEQEKPYLEFDLTLKTLARRLTMQTRHLSQLINESLNQNFFDFINRYRVDTVKELLAQKTGDSILEIAYDSGFNSKSSFNLTFKKYTGETPSQFRKKISMKP